MGTIIILGLLGIVFGVWREKRQGYYSEVADYIISGMVGLCFGLTRIVGIGVVRPVAHGRSARRDARFVNSVASRSATGR